MSLKEHFIVEGSANNNYSMALTSDGNIYAWGKGEYSKIDKDKKPNIMDCVNPKKFEIGETFEFYKSPAKIS